MHSDPFSYIEAKGGSVRQTAAKRSPRTSGAIESYSTNVFIISSHRGPTRLHVATLARIIAQSERGKRGMMRIRLGIKGIAIAGALALFVASAYADKAPDGTVEFSGGSVAAGIGYSWGNGTLTYKGVKYPITVSGLSAGASAGATATTASGSVYNLAKIEDFDGNYTAAGTGATVGGGASVVTMKNQNGVVIDSVSTTQGLKLSLDAGGVKIKVKR